MEVPSEVIYTLLDKIRTKESLWNTNPKDYQSKSLKRTLMDEINRELRHEHCKRWTDDDQSQAVADRTSD